ncbi:MAG: hypothetical protein M9927_17125 [Anaerolineae bacterium]|nr:hypothetical protein [Anaerolineae bacterium]
MDAPFQKLDRRDIQWDDFMTLVAALGAEVTAKGGSMVELRLNGRYAAFHGRTLATKSIRLT